MGNLILGGLALMSTMPLFAQNELKRPNIIHILMDDVG